ncbi:hypothetical protein A3I27_00425 [Candidatus Giovannonibacteria bacterium RIFCSPLOWO2_02_FULL_43_11b]|uniref:ComEC/Rec2-related protein domain-containing protein n=1 Tax=Candidatus Giovannonibacteria bacterium RIFCSPHIGHO2_12_FULL_43_15 TaxID=1798341 RepID=A0A1F5WS75_9BACT|nr:MAG: hypothetical protein A2739_01485 [Candidatus Giovannonibacteria bacterium RIFCSPHIGHO2_01_FULL_43_100]OGF66939.1 MAG: hypothetical protein A3B97_03630 [Candidatus Giovannonibacteria bacterium RIFCSPHIGHO2_02_FULL_43_32]OGF78121.1 MAG: hypothetical protein A3F23_02885 [Candidatus Giovannonibacteria bacterium RIFCSPHIGHO2_12_FULL_43_15]OGF78528.1 MAG: hypothetical protein A3A15_02785 [Candidatus Giovannonibacteria bacterium RIFCSPLOWO2_01_FULL_43_60]OGF89459.1 MAG: hypothetical protein A3
MRNLAIIVLFGFFTGVAFRSFFVFDLEFLILLFFIASALGLIFWRGANFGFILIQAAIFLAAFGLGILRYEIQDNKEYISALKPEIGHSIEISGIIVEDPQKLDKFTRAILKKDGVKILLTVPHYPEVNYGDTLTIQGKFEEPQNFSDFDWKNYLTKDDIYFEMFLPKITKQESGGGSAIKRFLFSVKHKFLDNLSKVLPEPHRSFLAGVTIGERASLPQNLEEDFRNIGVIHLVVLSGYNISIVSENTIKVLGYLPVAKTARTIIATIGVILFAILTGGSATVVRAAIMGILILWARETGKIYQALSALVFAAFLMVLINPKIVRFDASFQLSFLATAGLIFVSPRIEKYFSWFPNFWKLRENLVSTLSTQIFVLPLLIYLGGNFSWRTIPANLMILSAMPITMFFGFLTGLAGFTSYYLSWFFAWPAYWLLAYELWVVKIFS